MAKIGTDQPERLLTPVDIPDHKLIKQIGDGTYGTVWLATNNLGAFRAVKIVERSRFDDDRPYEREFQGLKRFEPVSREHEGLVDILQLGRNDQKGYFYYVMEAADGVNQAAIEPSTYAPRTLDYESKTRGRLPVPECLEISLAVADALQFLHQAKLVHRDIKPSNIIFVNGKAKIADIGLVAEAGQAKTIIGSTGFIAPEGPGKPQADIYSLGVVMYEIITGKDRQAFPQLPTSLGELPDQAQLRELNEIISRACDPSVARRYHNAGQLKADLLRVQAGEKPSELRRRRTRHITAGILCLLGCLSAWYLSNHKLRLVKTLPLPAFEAHPRLPLTGDWYGTSSTELLLPVKNALHIVSRDGKPNAPLEITEPNLAGIYISKVLNLDNKPGDEVFVSWSYGEGLNTNTVTPAQVFLATVDQNDFRWKTFECPGTAIIKPTFGTNVSSLGALCVCDLEGTGHKALLAAVSSGWSKRPRGLWCFDFETQKTNWFFETAGYVMDIDVFDLNEDGKQEILLSTDAPANSNWVYCAANSASFDDLHSELFLLSHDGKPLHWTNVGPAFSNLKLFKAGKLLGQRKQIIGALSESRYNGDTLQKPRGRLLTFDAQLNSSVAYDVGAPVRSAVVEDVNRDGQVELFLTDGNGYLHRLDSDLRLITKRRIAELIPPPTTHSVVGVDLQIAGIAHLTPSGENMLILLSSVYEERDGDPHNTGNTRLTKPNLYCHNDSLVVLNRDLKIVASKSVNKTQRPFATGGLFSAFPVQSSFGLEILVLSQDIKYYRLTRW